MTSADVANVTSGQLAQTALVAGLNLQFAEADPLAVLRFAHEALGRLVVVSSFGAESAVLLHMVAQIDPTLPVYFIDTELLFPETLTYQQELAKHLGLQAVIVMRGGNFAQEDPESTLHQRNPERCCDLRKTVPLKTALRGADVWVSGRKQFQSGTRAQLAQFETDVEGRIKVNPLAHWTSDDIRRYFSDHALPRHPLVAQGYPSIGCAPCTSKVRPGEDIRAGRWRGSEKTECGIHFAKDGTTQRPGAQI